MAAAYAALVSLFNNLEDIQNHPVHSFSFDNNQIQFLVKSVTFLIEFMESYDNCFGPSKEAAQLLERRITCAAHAAEEVIESHVVEQIRGGSTLDGKTRSPRFLLDLEKVTQDMDYVKRKVIKVQQARSGLEVRQPTYSTPASSSTPLTSEKTTMVGFDDLLLQLLDLLTGYPSSRRVIPIVGTGGVGKTTLAINAFKNSLIGQHFDVCLWATISQQYVVQDILLTLLSRQGESNISATVGDLGENLHKKLCGQRYLIILDDMWSVTAWDEIKFFFPDTTNGSRIVVTTRQSDIAHRISSSRLAISLLDDDTSWDLFCQNAFGGEGCPPELENMGRNIVRKCKGLPLAIVVVAGHIRKSSRTHECWENVANNLKSVLNSEENEQFFNILSFSYNHLPVHLKPCFIYMGTFKEDARISVEDLIKCWNAEGFLKPCKANKLVEDIAKDYLKDLIDRNLILDSTINKGRYSTTNKGSYCKIHDLLRELCLKVAEKEMFFYMLDAGKAICRERRVGIKEKIPQIFRARGSVPLVRSLRWETVEHPFELRLCRVLNYDERLFDEIGRGIQEDALDFQFLNLRYLRYSKVHQNDVSGSLYLPSSISLFWNLQTLIVDGEYSPPILAPNEIWQMIQLRHLEVLGLGEICFPEPLPSDLVMRNLQTLLGVVNFRFTEEVCKRVPNIKELQLRYDDDIWREYDEIRSYCCPHNLGCLRKLESLTLLIVSSPYVNWNHDHHRISAWREFALSLTFPSSLKNLSLMNTFLDWEEMTEKVGSLPHLENLYLRYVMGSEWSLVERKFLCLKSLTISYCKLDYWNADSSHFPVLENLFIESVPTLDELPTDFGTIPTLRSISLEWCSVSLAISSVRMVVEQEEENGNEDLKLYVKFINKHEFEIFKREVEEEGLTTNNLFLSQPFLSSQDLVHLLI